MVLLLAVVGCRPPRVAFDVTVPAPPTAAVAADHVLASRAGVETLRAGGNAVDAAIATALASGVVQPSGSGLGGGGFALVVTREGVASFLDFREVAPASASRDMYAAGASSTVGPLAVAVPAEALGLADLHRRWGNATLDVVAAPAIRLARDGFETGPHLARALQMVPMPGLFGEGNRRPALAGAIEAWRDTRGEAFRTGWVAEDFVAATAGASSTGAATSATTTSSTGATSSAPTSTPESTTPSR